MKGGCYYYPLLLLQSSSLFIHRMSHRVPAQGPTPGPQPLLSGQRWVGDSGGGSLPCESARSLSHAGVPWPGLPWPRGPRSESSGPQFQLGDASAVECSWPSSSSLPTSFQDGTGRLPHRVLRRCPLPAKPSPFVGRACERKISGEREKIGKRKNRRRESCLHPLLSKQGRVMNRSQVLNSPGLDLSPPPLHLLAERPWTSPSFL